MGIIECKIARDANDKNYIDWIRIGETIEFAWMNWAGFDCTV